MNQPKERTRRMVTVNHNTTLNLDVCPHCSSVGEIRQVKQPKARSGLTFYIMCTNCHCQTAKYSQKIKAVNIWNRRAG